jgi:hypothetical protein
VDTRVLSLGMKWPGCEADSWDDASIIKHRDTFAFYFSQLKEKLVIIR